MPDQNRQLAAILFTDIVGYTAMMQQDEGRAIVIVKRYISVIQNAVTEFSGKILNDYGDGSLCSFGSATQAVRCAMEIQKELQTEPQVPLRIGLHVGELFFEGEKVLGDGVNVASRVQSLGQPNTVLFSRDIYDKIKNQQEFHCASLGKFDFKNVDEPIEVFALSNEGLAVPKREKMEGKLKEIEKKSARKKWMVIAGIIIVLILSLLVYKMFYNKGFIGEKSIAVLPFENLGADKSEEYISDGITQDIINKLSKISSLEKVIAWFSVRGFKNTKKTIKQIADELGVAAILTGTIERQAANIHIVTELVDVNTNKRLWGEDYNYSSNDILSIQTNLSGDIANALRVNLTSEEEKNLSKHYTENVDAYKFYRKGRYFWDTRTKESFDSAESYYKKAIELDPDYALAYVGLADCYTYNQKGLTQLEAIPISRNYALKALSLDSNLTEALTTLGLIESIFDYDWVKSKKTLEKAIRLNPNYPLAHMYYGNLLQYTGESTKNGIDEIKKALELDPLSVQVNWVLGRNYWLAREYNLAFNQHRTTLALDPKNGLAKGTLTLVLLAQKKYSDALEIISQLPKSILSKSGDYQGPHLTYAYALMGDSISAKQELVRTLKENSDQNPYLLARAYVGMKNYNEALNQLENCYQVRYIGMYFIKVDPTFDPIRNESRFKALLKKMNLE